MRRRAKWMLMSSDIFLATEIAVGSLRSRHNSLIYFSIITEEFARATNSCTAKIAVLGFLLKLKISLCLSTSFPPLDNRRGVLLT